MAVTIPNATEQISYDDLYARWERSNWRATEIDFTQDRIDWHEKLTAEQRRGALWLYALFFHGEDSVTENLSPYIDAAPLEEQKYFLTTQQVDEARHSIFFKRFMHEVVGAGDGSVASTLHATGGQLTWGHRKVFGRLDSMADELRRDRSKRKLASAVTLYHIIVEATLAQPGQHIIESYLEKMDLLPGFREGMRMVSLDEQRHIGFGVKLLADLFAEDPRGIGNAIVDTIREVITWSLAVPIPPNFDRSYTECFGFSLEDIFEEGARSNESKLRAVGLKLEEIAHLPIPMDVTPRERGIQGLRLLECGMLGEPGRPIRRDPDAIEILFDLMARQARGGLIAPGSTIQWDFTDSEPWYLQFDSPTVKQAIQGRVAKPTVRMRLGFDDFIALAAKRTDPARLILRGKLRPWGDVRLLARMGRVFD